ncbi:MAG: hypothetical protein A3I02_09480 [Betaproteobacteria bacterium RIFCSPLOWO2_02_FULL_67_26]|nr:MAG: hypothetical protein A3I02_09480 [Betaproteobacteria bacterium RIFCSPLOWO2_02_FULL_67_26]
MVAAALPGQVAAQAPAPAAAAAKPAAKPAAEPLGRMFFTPAQRASLDIARTQRARTTLATEKTEEVATAAPVPQTITFDGTVRRSDGKTTFWLNNRAVNENEQPGGGVVVGRVRPDGGISLQLPQSGRGVDLKVGQSIELLSGTVEEPYSRKPPAPAPEAKPAAKPAPEAKGAKPPSPEAARAERDLEERIQNRVEESLRAQSAAGAKPAPATGAPEGPAK